MIPSKIAVTGRIKDWLKKPEGRLPVSCTVFQVQDAMEGKDSIEDSWHFVSKALRNAAGVALDLSLLRPRGSQNGRGLIASGPVSFAQIYSKLNEVLRRGGEYKNGAITVYLDATHPDAKEFLLAPRHELPWVKRAIYVEEGFLDSPLVPLVLKKMNEGDLWLAKKRYDKHGDRIFSQVCMEIALKHRGTCLLSHVNLGACQIDEIEQAFVDGMKFLCEIHERTGVGKSGIYLSPTEDRQVGLGCLGLANLLAIEGVRYAEFVDALEVILQIGDETRSVSIGAYRIARAIAEGFHLATLVALAHNMERAFTIAPTATCSYKYRDRERYTTTPEISPPICNPHTKEVERTSETFGSQFFAYHPNCESAEEVPWDVQFRLMKAWQSLMDSTGLAHAISFNIWDSCTIDEKFLASWFNSPLQTTYYRMITRQSSLDKSNIYNQLDTVPPVCDDLVCTSCAE